MLKIVRNFICKYKNHRLYHSFDPNKVLCIQCKRCKRFWYLGNNNKIYEFGYKEDRKSIRQIKRYIKCLR